MNNSRRIGALMAASVAAMGMATAGLASPAAAHDLASPATAHDRSPYASGPQPTSTWLRAVKTHTSTWVNIGWRTDRPACNVEVRVDGGRRVDIDYPGHRRYTSFSRGDTLRPGRADYTAVRINPDFNRSGVAVLRTSIRFDDCHGRRSHTQVRSSFLTLPVLRTIPRHPGDQGQQGYGQDQGHRNNGQNPAQQNNGQKPGQQGNGQNQGQQNQGQNNGQNPGQQGQNNGQQGNGQNNGQQNQTQPYGQKPTGPRS